eukprot:s2179_g8.t1
MTTFFVHRINTQVFWRSPESRLATAVECVKVTLQEPQQKAAIIRSIRIRSGKPRRLSELEALDAGDLNQADFMVVDLDNWQDRLRELRKASKVAHVSAAFFAGCLVFSFLRAWHKLFAHRYGQLQFNCQVMIGVAWNYMTGESGEGIRCPNCHLFKLPSDKDQADLSMMVWDRQDALSRGTMEGSDGGPGEVHKCCGSPAKSDDNGTCVWKWPEAVESECIELPGHCCQESVVSQPGSCSAEATCQAQVMKDPGTTEVFLDKVNAGVKKWWNGRRDECWARQWRTRMFECLATHNVGKPSMRTETWLQGLLGYFASDSSNQDKWQAYLDNLQKLGIKHLQLDHLQHGPTNLANDEVVEEQLYQSVFHAFRIEWSSRPLRTAMTIPRAVDEWGNAIVPGHTQVQEEPESFELNLTAGQLAAVDLTDSLGTFEVQCGAVVAGAISPFASSLAGAMVTAVGGESTSQMSPTETKGLVERLVQNGGVQLRFRRGVDPSFCTGNICNDRTVIEGSDTWTRCGARMSSCGNYCCCLAGSEYTSSFLGYRCASCGA